MKAPLSSMRNIFDFQKGSYQPSRSLSGGRAFARTYSKSKSIGIGTLVPKSTTPSSIKGSTAGAKRPSTARKQKLLRVPTHKKNLTATMMARAGGYWPKMQGQGKDLYAANYLLSPSCWRCYSTETALPDQANWRVFLAAAEASIWDIGGEQQHTSFCPSGWSKGLFLEGGFWRS